MPEERHELKPQFDRVQRKCCRDSLSDWIISEENHKGFVEKGGRITIFEVYEI